MQDQEQEVSRKSAWIDSTLIRDAKTIAAREDVTVSEVLERILRPGMAKEMKRVVNKLADIGGES